MSVKYLTNTLWFHNIFSSFNSRSYCTYYTFGSRVFNKKVKIQKLFIRIKLLGAKKKETQVYFLAFFTWKKGIQSEFRSSEGSLLLHNLFKVVTYMTDMNVKICQPTTWHLAKLLQLCTKWYFVSKIVLTYYEKKKFSWFELWKFEAESGKVEKNLSSGEQYIGTVKVSTIFETNCFFNLFQEVSQIGYIRIMKIQIGKNNWDLEICRKS